MNSPWLRSRIVWFTLIVVTLVSVSWRQLVYVKVKQGESAAKAADDVREASAEQKAEETRRRGPANLLRFNLEQYKPLERPPEVVSVDQIVNAQGVQIGYQVLLRNPGATELSYTGRSKQFRPLREHRLPTGEFELEPWTYECGEGLESVVIPAGQDATMEIGRDGNDPATYRFLGFFRGGKGRAGVTLLVDESKRPRHMTKKQNEMSPTIVVKASPMNEVESKCIQDTVERFRERLSSFDVKMELIALRKPDTLTLSYDYHYSTHDGAPSIFGGMGFVRFDTSGKFLEERELLRFGN